MLIRKRPNTVIFYRGHEELGEALRKSKTTVTRQFEFGNREIILNEMRKVLFYMYPVITLKYLDTDDSKPGIAFKAVTTPVGSKYAVLTAELGVDGIVTFNLEIETVRKKGLA